MNFVASSFVNWNAVWKIALAALIGGPGVVIVFGVLLLGLKRAGLARNAEGRLANYALSAVCGLICVGAIVVGIYAMAEKPASKAKKAKKTTSAALIAPAAGPTRLTASSAP